MARGYPDMVVTHQVSAKLIRRKPLKHDRRTSRWQWRRPVTICTAAIAKGTRSDGTSYDVIVTASDRMITLGGATEYTWRDQTKCFSFSNSIIAMTAGDPDLMLEIYRDAYVSFEGEADMTVQKVAERIAEKFRDLRKRRNERIILSPHGLSFDEFTDKQQKLAPTVLERIINQLYGDEGVLDTMTIVAGLDGDVGHIYVVGDPGEYELRDSAGFAAIGLGSEHASAVFAESMYTEHYPWTETVLLTYLAKKRAESALGVGPDTDLYWITPNGYGYVEPKDNLLAEFSKIQRDRDNRMRRAIEKGHRRLRSMIEGFPLEQNRNV
jgi:hypothetical protein